jgi:NAD(P)-dependent dehydrogenase (short-subunit alcohol dehydrogenase family)
MKIEGSAALVTGAGRGLGRAFAGELVSRGAAKVYGTARDPATVTEPGVIPVALTDVSLLVNNAGVMAASTFIDAPSLNAASPTSGPGSSRPRCPATTS